MFFILIKIYNTSSAIIGCTLFCFVNTVCFSQTATLDIIEKKYERCFKACVIKSICISMFGILSTIPPLKGTIVDSITGAEEIQDEFRMWLC